MFYSNKIRYFVMSLSRYEKFNSLIKLKKNSQQEKNHKEKIFETFLFSIEAHAIVYYSSFYL